jgi:hypothetical protein
MMMMMMMMMMMICGSRVQTFNTANTKAPTGKIHSNIILQTLSRISKWTFSRDFPARVPYSSFPHPSHKLRTYQHANNNDKVNLSLCLTKHHAMKTYWGSGGIASRILDLGTVRRRVVSFMPRPLYPQGRSL